MTTPTTEDRDEAVAAPRTKRQVQAARLAEAAGVGWRLLLDDEGVVFARETADETIVVVACRSDCSRGIAAGCVTPDR